MKTDCDLSAYIGGLPQLDAITLAEPDSARLRPSTRNTASRAWCARWARAAEAKAAKPGKAAKVDSAQGGLFDADDAAATEVAVAAQQRDVLYTTILSEAQLDEWLAKIRPPS
jgi:DNA polymerase-1